MRFDNDEPPVTGTEVLLLIIVFFLFLSLTRTCMMQPPM